MDVELEIPGVSFRVRVGEAPVDDIGHEVPAHVHRFPPVRPTHVFGGDSVLLDEVADLVVEPVLFLARRVLEVHGAWVARTDPLDVGRSSAHVRVGSGLRRSCLLYGMTSQYICYIIWYDVTICLLSQVSLPYKNRSIILCHHAHSMIPG